VLNGDAVTLKAEFGYQVVEGGWLRERIEGAGLTIENKR